jgi:Leucine-rich repeat (LRR) protein
MKEINSASNKEKRLFALGVCAFFIVSIVLIMHIDGSGEAENNILTNTAEEPAAPPAELPEVIQETEVVRDYIILRNRHYSINTTTHMDLSDMNLSCEDIVILQHLVNLTELNLWGSNQIRDISPLAGLTQLRVLQLGGNPVSDITPLENLVNLEELRMSDCNVSDLTPLTNLTKMSHLTLRNNQISDISPLANMMNLETLRLNGNPIDDWSPVAHVADVDGRP